MSSRQPVDHPIDQGPIREGPLVAVPPPLASGVIRRPRLEGLLDESVSRRLTTVVADAGFGKSTLLATSGQGRPVAWY
jgi:ATP/maltotriose-dependent transcriptional regulator MalT